MNWKLRFKNKATLLALITCVCTFVYQILGMLDLAAPISQDMVMQFIGVGLNVLVTIGVIVDPTTKGLRDSERDMGYDEPK